MAAFDMLDVAEGRGRSQPVRVISRLEMAFETVVAMNVTDAASYRRYREGMLPILEAYGGGFRHDFVVSEVLRGELTHPVTRVFVIYFRDRASADAFFADPAYKAVRAEHFDGAVDGFTVIASQERP
jgi:uncharacterized protein (DUF1330 family)